MKTKPTTKQIKKTKYVVSYREADPDYPTLRLANKRAKDLIKWYKDVRVDKVVTESTITTEPVITK
jgi:hypothetical protein